MEAIVAMVCSANMAVQGEHYERDTTRAMIIDVSSFSPNTSIESPVMRSNCSEEV
jgi:hypothetical protein